jgi:L-serine dehydratase
LVIDVRRVEIRLYGSLSATGVGHATDRACVMGLMGEWPDRIDPSTIDSRIQTLRETGELTLAGQVTIAFNWSRDLLLLDESLPYHPNAMSLTAFGETGELFEQTYYSVGGGFIIEAAEAESGVAPASDVVLPYDFSSAAELLKLCNQHGLRVSELMMANERAWRSDEEIRQGLLHIWSVMRECVEQGLEHEGILPGGLNVPRRAAKLHRTNGAAGIIPAVLHYYMKFNPDASDDDVVAFFLGAAAVGILCKKNASISGAEVGCQGEVGSACAMAAAGLADVLGATPEQLENAAEIGLEHNLGLTCDPVGGLVQVPCIERNAIAAVKAINATQMALRGDGKHFISLDRVIRTMRDTGADMHDKYKETSRGGLAVNWVEC